MHDIIGLLDLEDSSLNITDVTISGNKKIKSLEKDYQLSTIDSHFQKFAYSGIQVFHPSLLPFMDAWQGKFSIIDFYLSICHQVDIRCCYDSQLQLLDVGKLDTIAKAEEFLSLG